MSIAIKNWREPSSTELAWLSGIWEGEGSWIYRKGRKNRNEKPHLRMQMVMTDSDIMERVGAIMDGRKITYTEGGPVHKARGQKPVYCIYLQGRSALRWTNLMKPYLGKRRLEKYNFIMEQINEEIT
tara:strand:+ start:130 stop:510 length:381 start_codon:yes stop_codon:yes gene_type:complete